jgi:hypothetical protein
MSTSNQSASYDSGIPRSSLPAPPLLPEIPQGHPHIIDIISDFDSDDLSPYRAPASRPNVVPTPPIRPRAPSPPRSARTAQAQQGIRPLLNANDPLSIADLGARMRQLSERLEALSERAGERRRSSGFTNSSGLLGPPRRTPQRTSTQRNQLEPVARASTYRRLRGTDNPHFNAHFGQSPRSATPPKQDLTQAGTVTTAFEKRIVCILLRHNRQPEVQTPAALPLRLPLGTMQPSVPVTRRLKKPSL